MKHNFFSTRLLLVFVVIGLITQSFVVLISLSQNISNSVSALENSKIIKVVIEVTCDENEGFCELKKTLPDQPDKSSLVGYSSTILQQDFHYPKFVKIYYLLNDEKLNMRSHIKIADTPPPIFTWFFKKKLWFTTNRKVFPYYLLLRESD